MNTKTKRPRLLFLDNIKVLFTILVIFQHARVTYEGTGWWYYVETNPVDTFSLIFFIVLISVGGLFQSSLMGLFFLMGGYFTPNSYDRKGGLSFWKERLMRLGIPLVLYTMVINPIIYYLLSKLGIQPWNSMPTLQGSLPEYYISRFESLESFTSFLTDNGPMWFLYVLLIFTAGYSLWRWITSFDSIKRYIPKEFSIPNHYYLLIISVGLGCVTFFVRLVSPIDEFPFGIPFGFIIQYTMMFSIGVIALRFDWFDKMSKDHIKAWSIILITTLVLFYIYGFLVLGWDVDLSVVLGGPTLTAFIFAVVDNIIAMGMIFILIPIFYSKYNHQGTLLKNLSASAFHMYLIHPIILIFVSLGFASIPLIPVVKLAIVWPLTVVLCYLVSRYVLQRIRLKKPKRVAQNI